MDDVDIVDAKAKWTLPSGILAMLAGTVLIYSLLFATGKFLFGQTSIAAILFVVAIISAWILVRFWNKVGKEII